MPGGGGRKKPFSGKQKKQQLQAKRDRQHSRDRREGASGPRHYNPSRSTSDARQTNKNEFAANSNDLSGFGSKFFEVKEPTMKTSSGRYALIFRKETNDEIYRQKALARKALRPVLEEYLECKVEDFFTPDLDFPVRPPWKYDLSREELEKNEYRYFHEYLRNIDAKFERTDLSYFELNLETWRQLWRVLEMSDIILVIVDIRYPALLFPPKLYDYVCKELKKHLIIILNKVDLCPAPLVLAWKDYFKSKYPDLEVLCFTSYPSYNLRGNQENENTGLHTIRRKGRMKMAAEGALELYKVCAELVKGEVDLTSWKAKIQEEMSTAFAEEDKDNVEIGNIVTEKVDTGFYDFKNYKDGILTIGCLGQPNVGKSSLINALMGKKVVSVSRTPGHTKHFQTIFLTPNLRLCDCPGLIFPSKVPKPLQVLCGSYPIAQLREPYSTVKYLAERLDLVKLLRISHPDGDAIWSACDIADGWASKRGYFTAKAARLDTYRGANHILRMALEGKICLCLYPPEYCAKKDEWEKDDRIPEILTTQAKSKTSAVSNEPTDLSESEDESDEDEPGSSDMAEGDRKPGAAATSTVKKSAKKDKDSEHPTSSKSSTAAKDSSVNMQNKFAMLLQDDDDEDDDEPEEEEDNDDE